MSCSLSMEDTDRHGGTGKRENGSGWSEQVINRGIAGCGVPI